MDFLQAAEMFFYQLTFNFTIEEGTVITTGDNYTIVMLPPEDFVQVQNLGIKYPFNAENEILKLKTLAKKEGFSSQDAITVFNNLKEIHWLLPISFIGSFEKVFESAWYSINQNKTEEEFNNAKVEYAKYLEKKREAIFTNLLESFDTKIDKRLIKIDSEIIEPLFDGLKKYFPKNESKLLEALYGIELSVPIHFNKNQNQLTEVFLRLKKNGFITDDKIQIRNWICKSFQFSHNGMVKSFNPNTVYNLLTRGLGLPKKGKILEVNWLPDNNES